jgi:hypothetical protein
LWNFPAFLLLLEFALPFNRQDAVEHLDLDVLLRNVGQLGLDQILLVGLLDVDGRRPIGEEGRIGFECAQRRVTEEPVQPGLHVFQLTERSPLDDVHTPPLSEMREGRRRGSGGR